MATCKLRRFHSYLRAQYEYRSLQASSIEPLTRSHHVETITALVSYVQLLYRALQVGSAKVVRDGGIIVRGLCVCSSVKQLV